MRHVIKQRIFCRLRAPTAAAVLMLGFCALLATAPIPSPVPRLKSSGITIWVLPCWKDARSAAVIPLLYASSAPYIAERRLDHVSVTRRESSMIIVAGLQPGHYYFRVNQGSCNSFVGAQLFTGAITQVSVAPYPGSGVVIGAYDNSIAGTLPPNVPFGHVYLISPLDMSIIEPVIRTRSTFDFEFVRPADYSLNLRLTDGSVCQIPVSFRHKTGIHRLLTISAAQLKECIGTTSPSSM